MDLKKSLYPLFERDRSVQDRMFMLLSAVALIAMIIVAVILVITGDNPYRTYIAFGIITFYVVVMSLSIRFYQYKIGGIIIAASMGFVLFPLNFFLFGGIAGGAIIWFINYLLYISLVLSGRAKAFFLITAVIIAGACYYVSYQMPELLVELSRDELYQLSLGSLVIVGIMDVIMVSFGVKIHEEESKRSQEQTEKIAKLNASQNHFFSSMSHEIRTPINTIIGLNEMILRDSTSEEVREDAENIQAASKMLLQAVNDILDMSKFESGEMELTPAAYRTDDMLSEVVDMLWMRAQEKELEFFVDVSPDLPEELFGDEVRLKQILINVLNNAIKYTPEGSVTLQVQCEQIDDRTTNVVYTVSDTGIGIKKENIPYLFNAFRRVDQEENRFIEGTGLGLSIVKRLVELMNGKISVNSVYTQGSTFIIEIPQPIVSNQPIGEIGSAHRHAPGNRKLYHQSFEAPEARVLAVDDTAANLLVVKKLLRDTKIQLTTVSSGAEALKQTLDTEYHVILMDHMMPEMDGIECLHRIRTQTGGHCADAKIIALTANAGSDLKAFYAKEGFDGYLVKPVSSAELESELYHALPRELVHAIGDEIIIEGSMAWISEHERKALVAVTTESVADLPRTLRDYNDISVIPHMVSTENGLFRDGIDLNTRGLLEYMENGGSVMDQAPGIEDYESFFAQALQNANNVVHISITSQVEHSGCLVAQEAAKAFENVFVVDSGHVTTGQGIMALEACRTAREGRNPEEIIKGLIEMREIISTSFIVDNVEYLANAHQVSNNLGLIAKSISMHPIIKLKNGKLRLRKICIGSLDTAWENYVNSTLRKPVQIDKRVVFITHVGLSHRELEQIRALVERRVHFEHVYLQEASPAITVNCGPRTFGLIFMRKHP